MDPPVIAGIGDKSILQKTAHWKGWSASRLLVSAHPNSLLAVLLLYPPEMVVVVVYSLTDSCDPTDSCQAPLFMGFSRQEHWNGLPFPSPRKHLPEVT